MGFNFVGVDREQPFLMPPSVVEWLPEDHLAWHVIDVVAELDLSGFLKAYRLDGRGGAAYDPEMMVALLVYAYCGGQMSSRQIERACLTDVAFRVITANQVPDHTSIARFRQRHEEALKGLFVQVLAVCARAGMVNLGVVALDGTKLRASAALSANKAREQLDKLLGSEPGPGDGLDAVVDDLFAAAERADAADEARDTNPDDESPAVLRSRTERKRRLKQAKAELDAAQAPAQEEYEAKLAKRAAYKAETGKGYPGRPLMPPQQKFRAPHQKVNLTDPQSRVMANRGGGFVQGWNGQAIATSEQVIIACDLTNEASDVTQLHPMLDTARSQLAAAGITEPITRLLADAGYASEGNLASLDSQRDPDCFIATRNTRRNPKPRRPLSGPLPKNASLLDQMDRKVSTKKGRAIYDQRKQMIEPVFGQIKQARGIRSVMRRSQQAVASEWSLICSTHNLLKHWRHTLQTKAATPITA